MTPVMLDLQSDDCLDEFWSSLYKMLGWRHHDDVIM